MTSLSGGRGSGLSGVRDHLTANGDVRCGIRACSIGKERAPGISLGLCLIVVGSSVVRHKQHEAKHDEAEADDEDGHAC
jgi:hypothetical protein